MEVISMGKGLGDRSRTARLDFLAGGHTLLAIAASLITLL